VTGVEVLTSTSRRAISTDRYRTSSAFIGVVSEENRAVPPKWGAFSSRVTE
jgi:hypothetical protein